MLKAIATHGGILQSPCCQVFISGKSVVDYSPKQQRSRRRYVSVPNQFTPVHNLSGLECESDLVCAAAGKERPSE